MTPIDQIVTLPERVRALAAMHQRAKLGLLEGTELEAYRAERGDLVRLLLARQTAASGQARRRSLRVACAVEASLAFDEHAARGTTLDISTGGFAVLLENMPHVGSEGRVAIRVPGGKPVQGGARVVHVQEDAHRFRVGLEFLALSASDAERLDLFVFDALLDLLHG